MTSFAFDKPTMQPDSSRDASSSQRRRFLKTSASAAGAGCLLALGAGLLAGPNQALPATKIRPPGALDEADFLGSCVRCGLCVRACPFDTLKLASWGDAVPVGTPYFEARQTPCEMCQDIPCVAICPTGALNHELQDIDAARMGLAVLIDQENCLNYLGLRCDVCYRVCPLIDEAITLELQHNPRSDRHALMLPTVHSEYCTGCGKCEKSCVLPDEAAIKILPRKLAQGSKSQTYRRSWEESKAGASKPLIGKRVEPPVRSASTASLPLAAPSQSTPSTTPTPPAPGTAGAGMNSSWRP